MEPGTAWAVPKAVAPGVTNMLQSTHSLCTTLASFWVPPRASSHAAEIDHSLLFLYVVSLFFFALIIALMVYFAVRYRRRGPEDQARSQTSHSTVLELVWAIPPIVIVLVAFYVGLMGFLRISSAKANAVEVKVRAYQWAWEFEYPNGYKDAQLHLPVDEPVKLVLTSDDVIHSLFIPAFRLKRDVVPGRYNKLWFTATKVGEYPLLCSEYCGTRHSRMITKVVVHGRGEYEAWLTEASKAPLEALPGPMYEKWKQLRTAEDMDAFLAELRQSDAAMADSAAKLEPPTITGERLYRRFGCYQCHSTDGSRQTGPSFQGLWNRQRVFRDGGEQRADEDYIRRSIMDPGGQVVETYQGVMPTYKGRVTDRQIDALVSFIRSLESTQSQPGQ